MTLGKVRHDQRKRTGTETLDEGGVLSIEVAGPFDDGRVMFLCLACQLPYLLRRDLLCLFRRNRGAPSCESRGQAAQRASRARRRCGGRQQMIQDARTLRVVGLREELGNHISEFRCAL